MNGELLLAVNAPAILVVILILAAAITYVLRDWERWTALSAGVITGVFALLLWRLDVVQLATGVVNEGTLLTTSQTVERFGFTLQLHATALPAMALIFLIATVALLLAARFPQGRSFVPMTLALLAGYTIWYLVTVAPVDVSLILPLGLIILSALSAVALQAGRPVHAAGPLRWMRATISSWRRSRRRTLHRSAQQPCCSPLACFCSWPLCRCTALRRPQPKAHRPWQLRSLRCSTKWR